MPAMAWNPPAAIASPSFVTVLKYELLGRAPVSLRRKILAEDVGGGVNQFVVATRGPQGCHQHHDLVLDAGDNSAIEH